MKAATGLISKLRKERPSLVKATEQLCEAYIDLAYHDVSAFRKQRGPFKLPSSCPLLKLAKLTEVALPTLKLEVGLCARVVCACACAHAHSHTPTHPNTWVYALYGN